jgi:hypothetical protein
MLFFVAEEGTEGGLEREPWPWNTRGRLASEGKAHCVLLQDGERDPGADW